MARPGRPRKQGPRYPSGQIIAEKPTPNPRVVALRRELLGALPGEACDITQAENPLDVAMARGWLTAGQRRACDSYASLVRRVLTKMPTMRAQRPLTDLKVHAQLRPEERGLSKSGVTTAADYKLLQASRDLDLGKITPRQFADAEREHRRSGITGWSRMADAELAKIFDAMIDSVEGMTPMGSHGAKLLDTAVGANRIDPTDRGASAALQRLERDLEQLQTIWRFLTPAEARELMSGAVLQEWSPWLVGRVRGQADTPDGFRRMCALLNGLELVMDVISPRPARAERYEPPRPKPRGAMHEEHLTYVNQDGEEVLQVVRRRRS